MEAFIEGFEFLGSYQPELPYIGEQNYIALHLGRDHGVWNNGRSSGCLPELTVREMIEHFRQGLESLTIPALTALGGHPTVLPSHALLFDRRTGRTYVGSFDSVLVFCGMQHEPLNFKDLEDPGALDRFIDSVEAMLREMEPTSTCLN